MVKCCRPLKVEVFKLTDETLVENTGWRPPAPAPYRGMHGMVVVEGEKRDHENEMKS